MAPPENDLLSQEDINILTREIRRDYSDDPRMEEVIALLPRIRYERDYTGKFTGDTFEGTEDKEYWQARDKIAAFFKYGDTIVETSMQQGGRRKRKNKRRVTKKKKNIRKSINKRKGSKKMTRHH